MKLCLTLIILPWDIQSTGNLILITSTDWELEGELEYELQEGDEIVFHLDPPWRLKASVTRKWFR